MRPVRRAKTWIIGLEWVLCGRRRAERSYSTFKVRRGGHEKTPLVQGKEQRLLEQQ